MVLLVLTSCRLKDTRQAYPEDEGTAQQQQAVSQSGKHEDPEAEQGLPRESAAGNAGDPEGPGHREGPGHPGMPKQPEAPDWKSREPLSGQYKTWEPATSL